MHADQHVLTEPAGGAVEHAVLPEWRADSACRGILHDVLTHDVFPALGCTEPIAVAYAAACAGSHLDEELRGITITVDAGVYKNGFAVTIPNTGGRRGNLMAGILGALIARPELKMEIMAGVTDEILAGAATILTGGEARLTCDRTCKELYIEVVLRTREHTARAVIRDTHTNLVLVEKDGQELFTAGPRNVGREEKPFRQTLRGMSLADMVDAAENAAAADLDFIREGIRMNLRAADAGRTLERVGHSIAQLVAAGHCTGGVVSSAEMTTAAAADARMGGLSLPVMASGGSGNQGVVAILVPHLVGTHYGVAEPVIARSIALSHLVNSYIKCYTGDLSPLCGCAIAAGVGAAAALVYQRAGKDIPRLTLAVNNLVSDLGGMLCDGAKEGCALKVASSTSAAVRAAHMALNNHGIAQIEGFVGATAEETIRNLSRIGRQGMGLVNDQMLDIMIAKSARRL